MNKPVQLCQAVGLHPAVAFGMITVDSMLFGPQAVVLGTPLSISVAIAMALTVPCILVQKFGMQEDWGLAIGKGMLVGCFTAVPAPLLAAVTFTGGTLGAVALRSRRRGAARA